MTETGEISFQSHGCSIALFTWVDTLYMAYIAWQIESLHAICEGLQELIQSPPLAANCGETGKMDIDEECKTSLAVRLGVHITVWEFVLPITPSLPAVFGVSNVE